MKANCSRLNVLKLKFDFIIRNYKIFAKFKTSQIIQSSTPGIINYKI